MEGYSTIDAITGKVIKKQLARKVLSAFVDNRAVFGYVSESLIKKNPELFCPIYNGNIACDIAITSHFKNEVVFSKLVGCNVLLIGAPKRDLYRHKYCIGCGYPYSFVKEYEAVKNFKIFKDKQVLRNDVVDFPLQNYLKYTFGLEFETSFGIIPEQTCYEDGLIPLRDGSIHGNEYSTVVLENKFGLNLLRQQLNDLRKLTRFDKECSLHIHLGGYPLDPEKIFNLYQVCYGIQGELGNILPRYTFKTSAYKASGKDYCKVLPKATTFEELYRYLTGKSFYGSLTQSHPNDIDRERKWNIHQRYHWLNLINMVCYSVNKTVEFRLLRPTYSLEKILFWLYTFNAILLYSETSNVPISILEILQTVYPKEVYDVLEEEYYKIDLCTESQHAVEDAIGNRTDIEAEFFESDKII